MSTLLVPHTGFGGLWGETPYTEQEIGHVERHGHAWAPTRPAGPRRFIELEADVSNPASEKLLLTAEEVSDLIGMGVDWIYEQARNGRIPVVKLGRYRRFRREAIEQWISDNEK